MSVNAYALSADQRGVFVTAALLEALGPVQAILYSQVRWCCEGARHLDRIDGWTQITAAELARDVGMSERTVRQNLAKLVDAGHVERTQDLGSSHDRSSWWRLPGDQTVSSNDALRVNDNDADRVHPNDAQRVHVPLYETDETREDTRHVAPSADPAVPAKSAEPFEAEFNECWERYPKKTGRKAALKAFQARRREGVTFEQLGRATAGYAVTRRGEDPKYTMHGSTFYGPNERWVDYVNGTPVEKKQSVYDRLIEKFQDEAINVESSDARPAIEVSSTETTTESPTR